MKSDVFSVHQNEKGVCWLTVPAFDKAGLIHHGISTRFGGVSKGYCSAMNFSFKVGDDPAAVAENYRIFCEAIGADVEKCVLSDQTHTTNLRIVTADDIGKGLIRDRDYHDIDGLVTNCQGLVLVTHYADCVPLLFFDPVQRVIAASHGGWRGTVGCIAAKTVTAMQEHFGCDPADILCAIGPSICRDCFEVDTPVADAFSALPILNTDRVIRKRSGQKWDVDLQEANREILLRAGVKEEHITVTDLCTECHPDWFHSHRATGGKRGVIAAFICL